MIASQSLGSIPGSSPQTKRDPVNEQNKPPLPPPQLPLSEHSTAPQAPLEKQLEEMFLPSLTEMGFTDRDEIIASICRLVVKENSDHCEVETAGIASCAETEVEQPLPRPPVISLDDIMCDILRQRDEVEESHRMDQARALSEETRHAEAKRQRLLQQNLLRQKQRQASWSEWLKENDLFPHSWILHREELRTRVESWLMVDENRHIKETMISLLELEKKASKWYQNGLARCYFQHHTTERLLQQASLPTVLHETLESEIHIISNAMFSLSEQKEGVPRLFLDAFDNRHRNWERGPSGKIEQDDVVVVLQHLENGEGTSGRSDSSDVAFGSDCEVIE